MHYYDWNIKSYQYATSHLTNNEDLAYRRLLDLYYDTEKPIANDIPLLTRRLRLGLDDVQVVLNEFFTLDDDVWKHEYCDEIIDKYHLFLEKQRVNGSKGGRKSKKENNPKEPTANPKEPKPKPTKNYKPVTSNQEPLKEHIDTNVSIVGKAKAILDCPHREIIELYLENLPTGINPQSWDGNRASLLKARWRENPKRMNLEWWNKFFVYISQSAFLTGKVDTPGRKIFEISLPWILKKENFDKIIDGQYND